VILKIVGGKRGRTGRAEGVLKGMGREGEFRQEMGEGVCEER